MNKINKKIYKNKELILYFLLILVSYNIILNFFQKNLFGSIGILGDAKLYYCAATKFKLNMNPYDFADCNGKTTMHYQYSLIGLYFFYILNFLKFEIYKFIWLFLEIISFFIIIKYCFKIFDLKKNTFNFFLVLFGFGGVCWTGLLSGNISIILYALISISIYELYKRKIFNFCLLITFVAIFKPYLLLFLLLGFGIYKKNFIKYFTFTIIFTLSLHFFSYLLEPEYFKNYLNIIFYSMSGEYYQNLGSGIGIIGLSDGFIKLFNIFANNLTVSKFFWFFILLILSIDYILNFHENKESKIAYGVLLINLLNPYLMNYDLYILIPCLIYLTEKNIFLKNSKHNKIFCYASLLFIIIMHDRFSPLFLTSLFLFFISKNYFFEKKLNNL